MTTANNGQSNNGGGSDFAACRDLLAGLREGTLSAPEQLQLKQTLRKDAEARRIYARFVVLQGLLELGPLGDTPEVLPARALPVHSGDSSIRTSRRLIQPASPLTVSVGHSSRRRSAVLGFLGKAVQFVSDQPVMAMTMAVLVVVSTIALVVGVARNQPADLPDVAEQKADGAKADSGGSFARLIHAAECRWAGNGPRESAPREGDDLAPGQELVLESGLAEIMYQTGVRAVLEGPATLEIKTRTSADLTRGRLAVRVEDPDARGFEVRTPGMKYTDLGTEFAVSVAKDGTQEMHVIRGQVQAEHNPPLPNCPARLLTARQAVRLYPHRPGAPDKPMEPIAANEKRFVLALPPLVSFPIFSTGVGLAASVGREDAGLDRGENDPHWELTKISTDPNFKPRPAVVAEPAGNYVPDSRDRAQWISDSMAKTEMPTGCRWTFRTLFDLTGFDPASARIGGRLSADNFVVEIRVNGKSLPIPQNYHDEHLLGRWVPLKIEDGFVAGVNTLEFVIENGENGPPNPDSPMGLCVDWNGAARLPLKLKAGE